MSLRKISTPLTIGAFGLMAVTGVLMFFHKDVGLNKEAHEWFSWAFLAGVALHVAVNLNAFTRYFKMASSLALVGVFAVALGASFVLKPEEGEGGGSPVAAVMRGTSAAALTDLAPVAGRPAAQIVAELQAAGFAVEGPHQSVEDVAHGDRAASGKMLSIVFRNPAGAGQPQR